MSDDLATLETQRSKLLEEFLGLGDLRPGSITAVTRRCGKPSCHCAKHNDPGHDPQFRLTRRVAGRTVTETFPSPTALRKAQQEVAEFHRFQKLSQALVSLNDKICQLRPVEQQRSGWTEQEKKDPRFQPRQARRSAHRRRQPGPYGGRSHRSRNRARDHGLHGCRSSFAGTPQITARTFSASAQSSTKCFLAAVPFTVRPLPTPSVPSSTMIRRN